MMPEFPHHLVNLTDKNIEDTIVNNTIESVFESGPQKIAPRESVATRKRKLTYITCSQADFISFQRWFVVDIKSGSQFFLWKDYVDGVWKRVRITSGDLVARPQDTLQQQWEFSIEIYAIEEY